MVRAPFYDKNGMKKGAWSKDEDERLTAYIQRHGHPNWRLLPKSAGLARCGKSCRLRWLSYLRPDLKHGNYTQEEDERIIKLHKQLGNKWAVIAAEVPGRTDNEIKNHWHNHLKKRIKTTSEFKAKTSDTTEAESVNPYVIVNAASHAIVESSLSLTTESSPYTEEYYSPCVTSDHGQSATNRKEDNIVSMDINEELISSDFWTQPFMVEESSCHQDNDLLHQVDTGEIDPYIVSYSYDGPDWLYQLGCENYQNIK